MYQYLPAKPSDAAILAELRLTAMKPSLEAIGRFDPDRARSRFLDTFDEAHTTVIVHEESIAAFYVFFPIDGYYKLDHLYVDPNYQGSGIGSSVIERLKASALESLLPIRLGALRDSPSNRFYQHHGFIKTHEETWDIYYEWAPETPKVRKRLS